MDNSYDICLAGTKTIFFFRPDDVCWEITQHIINDAKWQLFLLKFSQKYCNIVYQINRTGMA